MLLGHVDKVKAQAENTILIAHRRIGEELRKVPKATGKKVPPGELSSKAATGIPKTNRHRCGKLADVPVETVKEIAAKLRNEGKDATIKAVVTEIVHGDKAQRREARQKTLAEKIRKLPVERYGVIYADPGWKTETWSEKGLDRSADLHYLTTELAAIKALDVASIAAKDAVLFLWTTVPHLEQALEVARAWGFEYKTMLTWDKEIVGTGHSLRNQTEHLIIATKGNVVAPGDDQKISSLYRERKTDHSVKPDAIAAWIERLYPDIPKINSTGVACRVRGGARGETRWRIGHDRSHQSRKEGDAPQGDRHPASCRWPASAGAARCRRARPPPHAAGAGHCQMPASPVSNTSLIPRSHFKRDLINLAGKPGLGADTDVLSNRGLVVDADVGGLVR